jgi:hypothetical protein
MLRVISGASSRLLPTHRERNFARLLAADSCGCATSALFLVAALLGGAVWFWLHRSEYSAGAIAWSLLGISFSAAAAGKLAGLAAYRIRKQRPRRPRAAR